MPGTDEREFWTTPRRAAQAAAALRRQVVVELRAHARALDAEADAIEADPAILEPRRHLVELGPRDPVPAVMLALAALDVQAEIGEARGPSPAGDRGERRAKARALLSALADYDAAAASEGRMAGATKVGADAARAIEGILGRHGDGTIRVGDGVEWAEDDGSRVEGRVVAIADGICAVAGLTRWSGACGSHVTGIATRPVAEVALQRPDFF